MAWKICRILREMERVRFTRGAHLLAQHVSLGAEHIVTHEMCHTALCHFVPLSSGEPNPNKSEVFSRKKREFAAH